MGFLGRQSCLSEKSGFISTFLIAIFLLFILSLLILTATLTSVTSVIKKSLFIAFNVNAPSISSVNKILTTDNWSYFFFFNV